MATVEKLKEQVVATKPKKATFSAFLTSDAIKYKINQMIAGKVYNITNKRCFKQSATGRMRTCDNFIKCAVG